MLYKDLEIYNELRKVTVSLTYRVKDIPRSITHSVSTEGMLMTSS